MQSDPISAAQALLAAGLEHHQAGRPGPAEAAYAQALALTPDEPTALYLSGLLAFETGRAEGALALLQRVTELRPEHAEARVTLAGVRHWLGQFAAAAEDYRTALIHAPGHAGALVGRANALRDAGDVQGALEAARAALARLPDSADAWSAFAASLTATGQSRPAVSAWREVVRRAPDALSAHVSLALALVQGDQSQEALRAAERAIGLDPGLAEAWFAKGAALAALHQPAEAAQALECAIALADDRPAAHLALGAAYAELDRAADAERALKAAIALDPLMAEAHASLGAVYLKAEKPEAARACYERALAIDPDMVPAHQNLAALMADAGEVAAAKAHRDAAYGRQNLFVETAAEPAARVLVLTTTQGGNTPFQYLVPKDRFTRIAWFIEYASDGQAAELPDHDVVFNAIGDPDLAGPTAANVGAFLKTCARPLLNDPAKVALTSRDQTPGRQVEHPDVVVPMTIRAEGDLGVAAGEAGLFLPLLVRPIGSHGGKGLVLARDARELGQGPAYLTEFHDFRSADGFFRKYRMIFVGGQAFPYHLAISREWMVHHGTADMAGDAGRIAEELRFLQDPETAIGSAAFAAAKAIGARLGLEYAGLDFSVLPDGRLLVFEANATMLVHPEPAGGAFAHKNPYVAAIIQAFQALVC